MNIGDCVTRNGDELVIIHEIKDVRVYVGKILNEEESEVVWKFHKSCKSGAKKSADKKNGVMFLLSSFFLTTHEFKHRALMFASPFIDWKEANFKKIGKLNDDDIETLIESIKLDENVSTELREEITKLY